MVKEDEPLGFVNKDQILQYVAVEVVKDYENNIKLHFVDHLDRFLKVLFKQKETLAVLKLEGPEQAKEGRKRFFDRLKRAKEFLLIQPETIKPTKRARVVTSRANEVDELLRLHARFLVPQRTFKKGNVHYDIKCSPQDYLPCLVYMMRWVETQGAVIPNIFPLRSSIIPKYVRLDTKIVIQHLIKEEHELGLSSTLFKSSMG